VSVGQLHRLKGRTDLVLTEAGPHGLPIIYGPDSPADPWH
ncbi:hypothetical protein AS28_01761, partial [Pygoscelis adeliae]